MPNEPIDPIDRTRLAKVTETWSPLSERFAETPCETPAQKDWWAKYAARAQAALKELEAERKELTQPLLDDQRRLKAEFDRTAAPVAAFKELARSKMSGYDLKLAQAERALVAEARAAAEAGDSEKALAIAVSAPEVEKTAGTATVFSWDFEVEDLAEVPRSFLVLDPKAVKAYIKTTRGSNVEPKVPGLKFTLAASTRTTGR